MLGENARGMRCICLHDKTESPNSWAIFLSCSRPARHHYCSGLLVHSMLESVIKTLPGVGNVHNNIWYWEKVTIHCLHGMNPWRIYPPSSLQLFPFIPTCCDTSELPSSPLLRYITCHQHSPTIFSTGFSIIPISLFLAAIRLSLILLVGSSIYSF